MKINTETIKEIDTAKVPENHIVIDFDIKGSDGNKSFEKNLETASKSGAGMHLHYLQIKTQF